MKNPYELILQGQHPNEVLLAASAASKFDTDTFANLVPTSKVAEIGEYASKVCRTSGVQSDLIVGGMLELFAPVIDEEHCPEVMAELIDDIQISRTQAYRCRAVWRHFGKALINEPEIRSKFSAESLKILSEGESSESARDEAIETARGGFNVTIKMAKSLRIKHAVTTHDEAANPQSPDVEVVAGSKLKKLFDKTLGNIWTFSGRVVQIVLEPTHKSTHADRFAVIEDLQAAIERLQQEIIDETRTTSEMTHV